MWYHRRVSFTFRRRLSRLKELAALAATVAVVVAFGTMSARVREPVRESRIADGGGRRAPSFGLDVRPILSNACFVCHGPDDEARKAYLRLDTSEGSTLRLPSGGQAIVPGDRGASKLWTRINSTDPEVRMPKAGSGKTLTAAEIEIIGRWIDAGAIYEKHWSFEPPKPHEPPVIAPTSPIAHPIDRFVSVRLASEGLTPAAEAPPATLLRRLALDLTGLSPSLDDLDRFAADRDSGAYERAVDRFLASAHFGEKWARSWLDLARYADTMGYEKDARRTIWPWRDWVIAALNADMPFDRFSIEQLAGDLLPDATDEQVLATAFHRNTMNNSEGGTDDEEFRTAAVIDRINATAEIWLGLTLGCAQCHTHKFDPITHVDYYRFFALFNNTEDSDKDDERPTLKVKTAAHGEVLVPVLRELKGEARRTTRRLHRGSFLSPAEVVEPGVPTFLLADGEAMPKDRLAFARWLFTAKNPLTARVAVNRIWSEIFGQGLVESLEDFGSQGSLPSHPELLDWLALRFRDDGWSLKRLVRLIVTSAAYRRSSAASAALLERDPANRLLGRGPRLRLDAEHLRDTALGAAGLLSPTIGGPSVFPYQPPGLWQIIYNGDDWKTSPGPDRLRRGLYTFWRRTVPHPALTTFDAPSREFCVSRRIRTNTPLQALVTLNDPAFVECAQALARRLVREGGDDPERRVDLAFRLALARSPTATEAARLLALVDSERSRFLADRAAAASAATDPIGPPPAGVDLPELAAWTLAASTILNLDEALTKE